MAQIYGMPGAEKNLLRECPPKIKSIEDIKPTLNNQKSILEQRENQFFEDLPNLIENEKSIHEKLIEKSSETESYWDEQIQFKKNEFNENKLRFWKLFELWNLQKRRKPQALKEVASDISRKSDDIELLETNPDEYFKR